MGEERFPTIRDLRDGLTRLVDGGLGDLPVQVLVVPASTMHAIALDNPDFDPAGKRALMIEMEPVGGRLPASLVSAAYLETSGARQ